MPIQVNFLRKSNIKRYEIKVKKKRTKWVAFLNFWENIHCSCHNPILGYSLKFTFFSKQKKRSNKGWKS
jgi:hypothetical protein